MATGDKKGVVMESSVGVAGGVAAYDATQAALAAKMDAKWHSNRNLLDNWYFGSPDAIVDQLHGCVVPSGVTYYSDTGLTTSAGTTSACTAAVYVNGTYGAITVGGTTYYVAYSDMERGYCGQNGRYCADRWKVDGSPILLFKSGITDIASVLQNYSGIKQIISENGNEYWGKTLTFSVLGYSDNGSFGTFVPYHSRKMLPTSLSCIQHTFVWGSGGEQVSDAFAVYLQTNNAIDTAHIIAMKLELGDKSTLAHNEGTDASPIWVLNDLPDHGTELLKCQRCYQLFRTEALRPAYAEDCRPVMRAQPTQGTVSVRGVTHYYNDANL